MEGKNRILLVISSERDWQKPTDAALKIASEKSANLHILYILEETGISYLDRLNETEFLSKKTSSDLTQALIREKRQSAYAAVEKIIELANRKNISVKSTVIAGDIIDLTEKYAKEPPANEIIISWSEESYLKKFFKGDLIERLRKTTNIPVIAITD
ncbi:MAG TPA: universal stress protein [bacterium]